MISPDVSFIHNAVCFQTEVEELRSDPQSEPTLFIPPGCRSHIFHKANWSWSELHVSDPLSWYKCKFMERKSWGHFTRIQEGKFAGGRRRNPISNLLTLSVASILHGDMIISIHLLLGFNFCIPTCRGMKLKLCFRLPAWLVHVFCSYSRVGRLKASDLEI